MSLRCSKVARESVRHGGKSARSAPAAAMGAIEDMQADTADLFHRPCPSRPDIDGVVVSRGSDLLQTYLDGGRRHGDVEGHFTMQSGRASCRERVCLYV